MTVFGFELDDLEPDTDTDAEEDDFDEEPPENPISKQGQKFRLGRHYLICGDSTKLEDIQKLLDNQKADLLITDPPYNVEIVGGSHGISAEERKKQGKLTIANDKMSNSDFYEFLAKVFNTAYNSIKDGASFYVWYASREVVNFQTSIESSGLTVKQELIWAKNSLVMGRQDYQWIHEPCLYGWKETGSHSWYSDRKQTTILNFDRPTKSNLHPTMKPIPLFDYQIKNSSKAGDKVLDLFGGSGTTLMACEQNGRNAYLCEFMPKYVDTIINRYIAYKGSDSDVFLINEDGTETAWSELVKEHMEAESDNTNS